VARGRAPFLWPVKVVHNGARKYSTKIHASGRRRVRPRTAAAEGGCGVRREHQRGDASRKEHGEEVSQLHHEIATLKKDLDIARGDVADLRRGKRYLAEIIAEMQRHRVTLANGRITTVYAIWENNLGEEMCCLDVTCRGCPDTDPADREAFDVR
jgi:hypothetical protein